MYLCLCYGITEEKTRALANEDVDYEHVVLFLKGEGKCCKCLPRTKEIFNEEKQKQANKDW